MGQAGVVRSERERERDEGKKGRKEEGKEGRMRRPVPARVRVRGRVRVRRHEGMCMRAHFRLRLATDPGRFDFLTCLMLDRSLMLGVKIAGRSHSCSLHIISYKPGGMYHWPLLRG